MKTTALALIAGSLLMSAPAHAQNTGDFTGGFEHAAAVTPVTPVAVAAAAGASAAPRTAGCVWSLPTLATLLYLIAFARERRALRCACSPRAQRPRQEKP